MRLQMVYTQLLLKKSNIFAMLPQKTPLLPNVQPNMLFWLTESFKQCDGQAAVEERLWEILPEKFPDEILHFYNLMPWHFFNAFIYDPSQPLGTEGHMEEDDEWLRRRDAANQFYAPIESALLKFVGRQYLDQFESLYGPHGLLARMLMPEKSKRDKLPRSLWQKLFNLLPFIPRAAGSLYQIPPLMNYVLEEEVSLQRIGSKVETYPGFVGQLGAGQLGEDTVLGKSFSTDYPHVWLKIGPVDWRKESAFHSGGPKRILLEWLLEALMPAEVDVQIEILTSIKASN